MVHRPTDTQKQWGGRLQLLGDKHLDADQQSLRDDLMTSIVPWAEEAGFAVTTDDGRFLGPMNIFMHRPALARPCLQWLAAEQQHSSLSPATREAVILTISVAWRSNYAVYSHIYLAERAGLSGAAIDAILDGRTCAILTKEQQAARAFAYELSEHRSVSDETYACARKHFGDNGLVDLVNLIGLYVSACVFLNAFDVPAPD